MTRATDETPHAATDGATPASLGFRMPAEWEPHRATWIAWPHHRPDWPDKFEPIPWVFAEFVRHLAREPVAGHGAPGLPARPRERVCILVEDEAAQAGAAEVLSRAHAPLDQIDFFVCPTDRVWTRDSGPIFVRDARGEVAATHWRFNAWAKYDNYALDEKLPPFVARARGQRRFEVTAATGGAGGAHGAGERRRVVLEGGALDVNGRGALLTTEECLLSEVQARNPWLDRAGVEQALADGLGARHVIWLDRGIDGDDTHGHVDDLARFVGPRTVVCCSEPDPRDVNHAALQQNLARLRAATDQDGHALDVIELPMPAPLVFEGRRLPASYANFYIGNHAVCVPTFNDPSDRVALSLLARLFPDRVVVGIHAVDLVWGFGTLHCMTQQEPLAGPALAPDDAPAPR